MRYWQFVMLNEVAAKNSWTKFVSMQDEYSLLYRKEVRLQSDISIHEAWVDQQLTLSRSVRCMLIAGTTVSESYPGHLWLPESSRVP